MNDDVTIQAPPVLQPAHLRPESAYRVAHDLLVERAPREALEVLDRALAWSPPTPASGPCAHGPT